MRTILHYGMHKTGSSSIQESLYHNLDSEAFQYVKLNHPNASMMLGQAFDSRFAQRPAVAVARKRIGKFMHIVRPGAIRRIDRGFKAVTAPNCIFSAEELCHLSEADCGKFIDLVRRYSSDICAVGYLRTARQFAESAFQQRLKVGWVPLPKFTIKINYRSRFAKFDHCLGRDNVQIWKFEPETFVEQCVVTDFCTRIGLDFPAEKVIRSNESISRSATQMLYTYRRRYSSRGANDPLLLARLGALSGSKFHLHSKLFDAVAQINVPAMKWIQGRVDFELMEDVSHQDDVAVRTEEDLLDITDADLNWLLEQIPQGGFTLAALRSNPDNIADAVRALAY